MGAEDKINYSVPEFCKAFGISRVTLYALWKTGNGPDSFTVGKRRLIPVEAARAWRPKQSAPTTSEDTQ